MPRFLLISPIYTASALTGGGQRTLHLYEALSRLGTVDVLLVSERVCGHLEREMPAFRAAFTGAEEIIVQRSTEQFLWTPSPSAGTLEKLLHPFRRVYHGMRAPEHFYAPTPRALATLNGLVESRQYDAIFGRYLQATALSGALAQDQAPVLVDLDDLDEFVVSSRAASPTTSRLRRLALQLRLVKLVPLARELRARCRHVFTATEADRLAIDHPSSSVLPNIPFRPRGFVAPPAAPDSQVVLFVGTYEHRVNREGVYHFVTRCWPSIHRAVPGARFRVVGSGSWERVRVQLQSQPGVEVVGKIDDLYGEYAAAALCVAPLHEGSGTKIKVLEALLYGRVVVATSHSTRGFEDLLQGGVVEATSDRQMVEHCMNLLKDPARRESMAATGGLLVAARYSSDAIVHIVERALGTVHAAATSRTREVTS
ncbi:MAG TPA: glycosyltransferase family 4 protein [Caldimonas sp.]|jgi:glycosyltransferase involved in cell wall biosynthesis|nr:glycosyltransferase family 4 protein [Caldimonas sp.]HEX2542005.1 glycosyltransferase family 4 protein [Caldimonas sp.]